MPDASVTKKVIAEGFKAVMKKKSFDKVTISDITDQCGLNRQTFYYHFQDKYELLNWILYTEVINPFTEDITIENWSEKLLQILRVVQKDSRFYSNAFNTAHGNEFRQYLFEVITQVLLSVIDQIAEGQEVSPDDKLFIAEFLSYGVSGSVTKWVRTGMKTTPEATVKYIQEIISGFKQFAENRYFK